MKKLNKIVEIREIAEIGRVWWPDRDQTHRIFIETVTVKKIPQRFYSLGYFFNGDGLDENSWGLVPIGPPHLHTSHYFKHFKHSQSFI